MQVALSAQVIPAVRCFQVKRLKREEGDWGKVMGPVLQVSITDLSSSKVRTITIDTEPAFLAGMGQHTWNKPNKPICGVFDSMSGCLCLTFDTL